jgi:hypothetical protein
MNSEASRDGLTLKRRHFLVVAVTAGAAACSGGEGGVGIDDLHTVENIQELRSVEAIDPNMHVSIRGLVNVGDGGEGVFEYVARLPVDSTVDDDIGYVINSQVPGQEAGRWIRITDDDDVSVQWFGAQPDGTNVALEVLAAQRASESLGCRITAKPGVYRVDGLAYQTPLMELEIDSDAVILTDYIEETGKTVYYFNHSTDVA